MGTDPGKAIVERLTNIIDANLEREFERHDGKPLCDNPREVRELVRYPNKGFLFIECDEEEGN